MSTFFNILTFMAVGFLTFIILQELVEFIVGGGIEKHQNLKFILVAIPYVILMLYSYSYFFPKKSDEDKKDDVAVRIDKMLDNHEVTISQHCLTNGHVKVHFGNLGGQPSKVELLQHQGPGTDSLVLLDATSSQMGLEIPYKKTDDTNGTLHTAKLPFKIEKINQHEIHAIHKGEDITIAFKYKLKSDYTLEQAVKWYPTPTAKKRRLFQKSNNAVSKDIVFKKEATFVWRNQLKPLEDHITQSRPKATLSYLEDGSFKRLKIPGKKPAEAKLEKPIAWVSNTQQFFTAAVAPSSGFTKGNLHTTKPQGNQSKTIESTTRMAMHFNCQQDGKLNKQCFTFYFGPNAYAPLKATKLAKLARNADLGSTYFPPHYINKYVILPIFKYLQKYIKNFGLLILLLACLVALFMLPINYYAEKTNSKIKCLKPELDKLTARYPEGGGDLELARGNLYQSSGINPLMSFLPLLFQLIVLTAMNTFFKTIIFRKASLLWITNLASFESTFTLPFYIPFIGQHISVLALIVTLLQLWPAYNPNSSGAAAMQGYMLYVKYVLLIPIFCIFNSAPAGLCCYRFISFFINKAQTFGLQLLMDKEALHTEIERSRKKAPGQTDTSSKSRQQLRWEKRHNK